MQFYNNVIENKKLVEHNYKMMQLYAPQMSVQAKQFTQEAVETNHEEILETNAQDVASNDLKEFGVDSDAPDLFSSETDNSSPEDLLTSDEEEEDDLEIPAFLRRQKN